MRSEMRRGSLFGGDDPRNHWSSPRSSVLGRRPTARSRWLPVTRGAPSVQSWSGPAPVGAERAINIVTPTARLLDQLAVNHRKDHGTGMLVHTGLCARVPTVIANLQIGRQRNIGNGRGNKTWRFICGVGCEKARTRRIPAV